MGRKSPVANSKSRKSELQDILSPAAGKTSPLTGLPRIIGKNDKSIYASPDRLLSGKNQFGWYQEYRHYIVGPRPA
jgi:hypothetical protein